MSNRNLFRYLATTTALVPIATCTLAVPDANANPQGGEVVAGEATISTPQPNTLVVKQGTDKAIINWQKFNIAAGETTRFKQPHGDAWTLNRVIGSQDPSRILGTLEANGNVVIVNPDGVHFGPGSRVDVNRLIATTSDISNDNFMSGNMIFDQPGHHTASVVNEGNISIKDYGLSAFVAPAVRNSGVITARLGTISLASGNTFTIDPYGDGLVKLTIDDEIKNHVYDVATGQKVSDLVKNEGTLKADGGTVAMSAATARLAVNSVVNNTGVIEANTIEHRNGKIILGAATQVSKVAGAPRQVVRVSGTIKAAYQPITRVTVPSPSPRRGGEIEITGETIVSDGATIDASGADGGGKVLIGGDYLGGSPAAHNILSYGFTLEDREIPTATFVALDEDTTITADATDYGNGGKVVVWSDEATLSDATITARGGQFGGNGGFIETSGRYLQVSKAADASAPNGLAGTWLLDPYDMFIRNTIGDSNVNSTNTTIVPGINGTRYFPTGSPSVISTTTIQTALNNGNNVQVTNRGVAAGGETGNIYLEDSITKTLGGDVFFNIASYNDIIISAGVFVTSTSGKMDFHLYATDGAITGNSVGQIFTNGGVFLMEARDGINVTSPQDMPENTVISTRSGPSPTGGMNVNVTFDDDHISYSHANNKFTFAAGAIRLADQTASSGLELHLGDFRIELANNAVNVLNSRSLTFRSFADVPFGATANAGLDGQPEIVSDGPLQFTIAFRDGLPEIVPVIERQVTGLQNCPPLACIPTGPSGQRLIDAYVNPGVPGTPVDPVPLVTVGQATLDPTFQIANTTPQQISFVDRFVSDSEKLPVYLPVGRPISSAFAKIIDTVLEKTNLDHNEKAQDIRNAIVSAWDFALQAKVGEENGYLLAHERAAYDWGWEVGDPSVVRVARNILEEIQYTSILLGDNLPTRATKVIWQNTIEKWLGTNGKSYVADDAYLDDYQMDIELAIAGAIARQNGYYNFNGYIEILDNQMRVEQLR